MNPRLFSWLGLILLLVNTVPSRAEPEEPTGSKPDRTVATVNSQPIFESQLKRRLAEVVKNRKLTPEARKALRAKMLEQLIDELLVYDLLKRQGQTISKQAIDGEIKATQARLEKLKISWSDFLEQNGYTELTYRRQFAWRASWANYLKSHVTDKRLKAHFEKHRRQYDGGQVRASQIFLKRQAEKNSNDVQALVEKALKIRKEITDGKLTFDKAAKKYSDAPSRKLGGDIGFFPRHGVQGEGFSKAAFQLEKGKISQAVISPLGVHLILCTDIQPGNKDWKQARDQLQRDIIRRGFENLARQERASAKIDIIDGGPKK